MQIRYRRRPRPNAPSAVYLLDLDNTLHLAHRHILPEINQQMTEYVAKHLGIDLSQAGAIRNAYWRRYGATLLGMVRHHQTDPHHFLAQTHRFDSLKGLSESHGSVIHTLKRLSGTVVLLTNAPREYAQEVLQLLGLGRWIHAVVAIEDMVIHQRWRPKPDHLLWPGLKRQLRGRPIYFVDDTLEHLRAASRSGIRSIWITHPAIRWPKHTGGGAVRHRLKHFRDLVRFV